MKVVINRELSKEAALGFAVIVLAIFLNGCGGKKAEGAKGAPNATPEIPVFAVNTAAAESGQIEDYLALAGDIISGSSVDAYSDAQGKVTQLYASVGQRVSRGDALAAIDPSRPGMAYVQNIVRSPIQGTITSMTAQVGMTVSQSVPIARIAGSSALEIELNVAERFISKIAPNIPCEIRLDAWPGDVFRGSVREISPVVNPVSRTMAIKVNVENPGAKLKAGMFAKVRVITERREGAVKIPSGAQLERNGESYVFVVETDDRDPAFLQAKRRVIKPGILVDGVLEVQEGLKAGDEVVTKGQTLISDGSRVNVVK